MLFYNKYALNSLKSLPILVVYDKQVQYTNKSKAFYRKLVELCVKQLYLYETDQLIDPLEDLGFSTIFKQFLNKNGKIINFFI